MNDIKMQQAYYYTTILGTGNALATQCYNTCFTLHGKKGLLVVDAGGGNGILTQLERADTRREHYTAEAKSVYHGNVVVPDDLEQIRLSY